MLVKACKYKYSFLRVIEIFLGLVFITSAVLKVIDINRFCVQIYAYGVIENKDLLPFVATTTILIEISLGVLFLSAFPYRRISMGINLILLVTFTFLILYGWIFNNLKDCGCFGRIEIGPGTSIAKNLLLILCTAICFMGVKPLETENYRKRIKYFLVLIITVISITLFFSIAKLNQERLETKNSQDNTISPYAGMVLEIDGKTYNLSKGEYLIALISFGCDHCLEEAPKLNQYTLFANLPTLIALCLEESSEDKEEFITKVQPEFPIYSLGNKVRLFFSLIGKEPPRLVYLKDGQIIKYWDYDLPLPDKIEEEIRNIKINPR